MENLLFTRKRSFSLPPRPQPFTRKAEYLYTFLIFPYTNIVILIRIPVSAKTKSHRFQSEQVTFVFQLMNNLETDGLGRALANAGSALDAVALINLGSAISDSDSTDGASADAALAADAFLFINFCSHFFSPC